MGMIRKILNINGADRSFICDSEKDMLSDVIRNLGLTGTKIGCGKGQCGACNVILNGKLVRSCVTKISKVEDYSTVYTIEGMGTANNLHPIQLAWMVYGGVQCGFCTPGFVVSTKALLDENPNPTREDVRAWFQKYKNACRCTGYKPIVDAVMAAAKVMRGELTMEDLAFKLPKDGSMIGSKAPKPSAVGKVLGTTDFGADVADKVPGMVHLAMVVPPVNHGIIKSIDISEAEKAPGVIKVILAKDLPGNRMSYPQTSIWALGDGCERPLICDEKVFRFGDPVAVVAAETRRQAREAAKMVRYEIEELPAYMDVLESVKPDAMEIHPGLPNLYVQKPLFKGDDPRDIIKNAPYSVEFNFGVQRQPHFTIEPDCCNAFVEEDGTLTVMYKTHGIYMLKGLLAKTLGLPDDKVRVVLNPSGGAFGYTLSPALPCLTAACALVLGRPASFVLSYEEHIRYTGKRSPNYTNTRLACDENGKILASDTHVLIDKGCYSETGAPLINSLMKFIYNNYNMPSTRCLVSVAFTNTPHVQAYRCPGSSEVGATCEQAMDMLAEKVGIDPLEFRYINCWTEEECDPLPQQPPRVFPMRGILDAMRPKYQELKAHAEANTTPEKMLGVGVATGGYKVSFHGDSAKCAMELNADNTFTLYNTWEDMGQGADIGSLTYAVEALKPLGVTPDRIKLVMNDTAKCPDSGFAGASRSNFMHSYLTHDAAQKLMDAMRKNDGTYRTYEEMVAEGIPTKYIGEKAWPLNKDLREADGHGNESPDQSFAAFVAEVEVEATTGKIRVLDLHCFADFGITTNQISLEGQAYSGMEHSLGYALSEDYSDVKKHASFVGGGFPYIEMMPDGEHFTFTNLETPRDYSPTGTSGCAEGLNSAAHSAILNALYNATGIRVESTPARPEKVKKALEEKAAGTFHYHEPYELGDDMYAKLEEMYNLHKEEWKGPFVIQH